jgi:hypothetical protein
MYKKLKIIGLMLVSLALVGLLVLYFPVIIKEINYLVNKPDKNAKVSAEFTTNKNLITAADENFSIVIPKVSINSKVVKDVDPYNSKEYQRKLTEGVAHAKGSALPDGNFLLPIPQIFRCKQIQFSFLSFE